jgi:hypothetical protein
MNDMYGIDSRRTSGDQLAAASLPRVAVRTRQPWAVLRMPFGQGCGEIS